MKRILSSFPVLSAACSLLLACEFGSPEPLPEDGEGETPWEDEAPQPGTGGNGGETEPGTGGAGGSSCETAAPARTFQCAGSVNEAKILDRDYIELYTMHVSYACGDDPYSYGTGGAGTGGS